MRLNRDKFHHYLGRSALRSVCQLARESGLHRNTINHYLANAPVYQQGYLALCQALNVSPEDLVESKQTASLVVAEVARTIDELHKGFLHVTFVLMGSRARGTHKKYSDWDIGFFSYAKPMTHQTHLDLLKKVDDLLEDSIEEIELVNLNDADEHFLKTNKYDFIFLTGSLSDWAAFQEKIHGD